MLLLDIGNIVGNLNYSSGNGSDLLHDFILEDLKVGLQDQTLANAVDSGPKPVAISLCMGAISPPSSHAELPASFPIHVPEKAQHSVVYIAKPDPIDMAKALELSPHDAFNVALAPSTPISEVNVAFRHQKRGICLDEEIGDNLRDVGVPSAISVLGDDQNHPSTVWLGNTQRPRSRAPSVQHAHHRLHEQFVEEPSPNPQHMFRPPIDLVGTREFLLDVKITGRFKSITSNASTTFEPAPPDMISGVISSSWTGIFQPHAYPRPTKVRCLRQGVCLSTLTDWSSTPSPVARDCMAPIRCVSSADTKPRSSMVAGSRKHTASHLAGALSNLSSFQNRLLSNSPEALSLDQPSRRLDTDTGSRSPSANQNFRASVSPSISPLTQSMVPSLSRRFLPGGLGLGSAPANDVGLGGTAPRAYGSRVTRGPYPEQSYLQTGWDTMTLPSSRRNSSTSMLAPTTAAGLIVHVGLVLSPEEGVIKPVRLGQVFWVEVMVVNRCKRSIRLEVGLGTGNSSDWVTLDDSMIAGSVVYFHRE